MVKGIKAEDILQSLPTEQRLEFEKRLKSESGVDIRLTATTGHRRKRKWFVKGKVIGVRFTDEQIKSLECRALKQACNIGEYIKRELFRDRHGKKP